MISWFLGDKGRSNVANLLIELINLFNKMTCLFRIHIFNLFRNQAHRFVLFKLLILLFRFLLPFIQLFYIVLGKLYRLLYVRILFTQAKLIPLLYLLSRPACGPESVGVSTSWCSSPISHETGSISLPKLYDVGNGSPHFELFSRGEFAIMENIDGRNIDSKLALIWEAAFLDGDFKVYVIIN